VWGTEQKATSKTLKLSQGVPVAAKYSIGTFFARASQQQSDPKAAPAAVDKPAAKPAVPLAAWTPKLGHPSVPPPPLASASRHNIAQGTAQPPPHSVAKPPAKPQSKPPPKAPKAAPKPWPKAPKATPEPEPKPPPAPAAMGNICARCESVDSRALTLGGKASRACR
jgi:hypothetical protein